MANHLLKKPLGVKIRFYGLVALILSFCVVLMVTAVVAYTPRAPAPQSEEPVITSTPSPTPINQTENLSVNTTDKPAEQENNSLISKEQALAIAMPVIDKFAAENNLTLISVTSEFSNREDDQGLRGGAVLLQLLHENLSVAEIHARLSVYPVWDVAAHFNTVTVYRTIVDPDGNSQLVAGRTIDGYSISIWADTSQIFYSSPQPLTC